jgi:ligand-binding sensor domain-containing protein/DNA-binding NarL/FixJ family response regulator
MKRSGSCVCMFVLCCLTTVMLSAQHKYTGIPYIKNYTRQQYYSSPFNWAIIQDAKGMIYVGNEYFMLEMDGNTWRSIGLPNRTIVRSLAIDKSGKIYVGGQADFGYLAPDANGQMTFISLKDKIEKKFQNFDDVWKTYVTREGVIFFTAAGLYYYADDKISFYKLENDIQDQCFYVKDRLFVTHHGKGISEFKNGALSLIPNSHALSSDFVSGMLPSSGNEILVVTQRNGIFKYDGYSNFTFWDIPANTFLQKNLIVSTASLSNGYVFGSAADGILMIDKEGVPVLHLNKEKGLQNNGVEYIYPDNTGNLWLALRDGVDYVEINSPFSLFNVQNGIAGSGFTSLIKNNKLYLGTTEGLYYKEWSTDRNVLNEKKFRLIKNSEGRTYNLQQFGDLMLLSHNLGLFQIRDDQAEKISGEIGAWLVIELKSSPGYFLCGTYKGLELYTLENGKLKFINQIEGFKESSRIMEEDEEGNIWVAHGYKGLYRIRLNKALTKAEKIDFYNQANGFPSNAFINVFKVDNKLVFTGERGIFQFDKATNRFIEHEEFPKYIDKRLHTRKLIEDKEGNVWYVAGDEVGILRKNNNGGYDVQKTIFNKLGRKLIGGFEHIMHYDKYNVIIGIDEGFVHFDPSFTDNYDRKFNTVIRKVQITSEKDSLLSGGSFSEYTAASPDQPAGNIPVLPYSMNGLRFTYSALSFTDADKVQYQYFLEGYDKTWSSWTFNISKEYTNLREGHYVFKVKAKDIYNRVSDEVTYQFSIRPPWYRSFWAYGVYSILVLLLLYSVRKITKIEQQRAMRLKEAEHMEEVLHHKTKELTSSAIHVAHSVETIQKLRSQILEAMDTFKDQDAAQQMRKVLKSIDAEVNLESNWEQFETHFNQIHQDFLIRLRKEFPELTPGDIKLCAYLRLNLSSKEIAQLLNISLRGIEASRYRLRKKMNLSPDINLTDFIMRY